MLFYASSVEKQELIQLEITLTNLFDYKEQLVLNPTTITEHTTDEIDTDIEVIKAQIHAIITPPPHHPPMHHAM